MDKKISVIFLEILVGIAMACPLILNENQIEGNVKLVIARICYSIGVVLVLTRLMNLIFRILHAIFKSYMLSHDTIYRVLAVFFIVMGVVIWNKNPNIFDKGYFWLQIVAYIICSLWLLIDINATKCIWCITMVYYYLEDILDNHKACVGQYKIKMNDITRRKDILVNNLEPYCKRTFLKDPLKQLRKDPDISYIDGYLQDVPEFHGEYSGLAGLLCGTQNVAEFMNAVTAFNDRITEEETMMNREMDTYDGYIEAMEKRLDIIKKSGQEVEMLEESNFDSSKYRTIYKKDIKDVRNSSGEIKDFWKMNKKINKVRRRYGR